MFIVAAYVSACSQGQRMHSARTNFNKRKSTVRNVLCLSQLVVNIGCGATLYTTLCVCVSDVCLSVPRFVCAPNIHTAPQLQLDIRACHS
jgi:hypothetical protein